MSVNTNINTFDLFSLKGKVALITGGRAMYGRGCTMALIDAGAKVYLASHSIESAQTYVEELRARGGDVEAVAFDQGDIASIDAMIKKVVDQEGRIDVFIHCSRILPKGTGVGWYQDEAQLTEDVNVNTAASLYMTSAVGEQMIKQRSGSIVTFGSMMGLIGVEKHNYDGEPGMGDGAYAHAYALSKSGLSAWVRHAASYYGQYGVRINAVCPGGLESDRTPPLFKQNYSNHTQLGRLANGNDIKGPVLFLASDASAYLTGLSIPVDGGYTCI
jgi:NAD(P)-dependent dehydrogenase (short-subunit alcohol dehydrogenase family)